MGLDQIGQQQAMDFLKDPLALVGFQIERQQQLETKKENGPL